MAPKSWSTHAGGLGGGDIGGAGGPDGGSGGCEGGVGGGGEGFGDEGGGYAESPPPHAQHLRVGSYRRDEKGGKEGEGTGS